MAFFSKNHKNRPAAGLRPRPPTRLIVLRLSWSILLSTPPNRAIFSNKRIFTFGSSPPQQNPGCVPATVSLINDCSKLTLSSKFNVCQLTTCWLPLFVAIRNYHGVSCKHKRTRIAQWVNLIIAIRKDARTSY